MDFKTCKVARQMTDYQYEVLKNTPDEYFLTVARNENIKIYMLTCQYIAQSRFEYIPNKYLNKTLNAKLDDKKFIIFIPHNFNFCGVDLIPFEVYSTEELKPNDIISVDSLNFRVNNIW